MIFYKSTRGESQLFTFSQAILKGIATDGGLFVPTGIPKFTSEDLKYLVSKSYQELCFYILKKFETGFPDGLLRRLIYKAYSGNFDNPQIAPLIHLKDNQYILELWHGPTSAFKDMALQIMPYFFAEALKEDNRKRIKSGKKPLKYLILVATSGDTGKAALVGFKNKKGISIIVFYPKSGVSSLQELSMTTQVGNNLEVIGINGYFDDAQRSVKDVFNDKEFNKKLLKKYNTVLSSANSINWGRLLQQVVYHVRSYLDLVDNKIINYGDNIDIAVPTGNFGNILAAFYAKKMGVPIRKLICASNENNVLTRLLQKGIYDINNRELIKTPSPSMDILISSNLERLLYEITRDEEKIALWMRELKEKGRFEVDPETKKKLKQIFYADWVSNRDCLTAVKNIYKETNYLLDPHTAVAQVVSDRYGKKFGLKTLVVICSTAHFAKFPKDVYKAMRGSEICDNEFELIRKIKEIDSNLHIPKNILDLKTKKILHIEKIQATKDNIERVISRYLSKMIQ